MPNWCENKIQITGPDKDLKKFLEEAEGPVDDCGEVKSSAISMERLLPPPENLDDNARVLWQIENWGTKWDCPTEDVNIYPEAFYCRILSASAPPIAFFRTISVRFPNILFKINYFEPGMMLAGIADISNGHVNSIPYKCVET